jgi:signal transduction histidine kinase/DNA-binding response OmpR family regulator
MKTIRDKKSIKNKIITSFLVMTLLPLMTVMTFVYFQSVRVMKRDVFNKLVAIRTLKVDRLNHWALHIKSDMELITQDTEVINGLSLLAKKTLSAQDKKVVARSRAMMSRFKNSDSAYQEIFIINPKTGIIELSTNKNSEGSDKTYDDFYKETKKTDGIFIKDIYFSNVLGALGMGFSSKIISNNEVKGLLVIRINLVTNLFPLLKERTGLGSTGETLIINKNHLALNELRWHENAPLKLKIGAEPAKRAVAKETGIIEAEDYRGEKILGAYSYVEQLGWGFVVKQDLKESYASIHKLSLLMLALIFVVTMISIIVSFLLGNSLTLPIKNLALTAEKIGKEEYDDLIEIDSNDELGFLSTTLKNAANNLKDNSIKNEAARSLAAKMIEEDTVAKFVTAASSNLLKLTNTQLMVFYFLDEAVGSYRPYFSFGANEKILKNVSVKDKDAEIGKCIVSRAVTYLDDIADNSDYTIETAAGPRSIKSIINIPLVSKNKVNGVISMGSLSTYSDKEREYIELILHILSTGYITIKSSSEMSDLAKELESRHKEVVEQSVELTNINKELENQTTELKSQKLRTEEANRLKSEFLSNMSHELRTPLNSILAISQGLLAGKAIAESKTKEYIAIVERNGRDLLALINDILDLSKIEAGKDELLISTYSVPDIVNLITDNIGILAEKKGIKFEVAKLEKMPHMVGDIIKIRQILTNICANAVKFTEKGTVSLRAHAKAEKLCFEIKDTGIGIPQAELSNIFQEFRQIDGTASRKYSGTGLGLAISSKLAEAMGGEITVASVVGAGSVFTFCLPQKIEAGVMLEQQDSYEFSILSEGGDGRILLVEDNADSMLAIKDIVEDVGLETVCAKNGSEAKEIIGKSIPSGVILDLMMPGINGFDVLEFLRADAQMKKVPVIIISAKTLKTSEYKVLLHNNVSQIIQKGSLNRAELQARIKKYFLKANKIKKEIREKVERKKTKGILKRSVLIVEDNADNVISLKLLLEELSANITVADTAKKGIKILKDNKDMLVLMDINLPDMSGTAALKKIREDVSNEGVPVIAVTAKAMKGDRENLLKQGFDDYISKPLDKNILLETVKRYL